MGCGLCGDFHERKIIICIYILYMYEKIHPVKVCNEQQKNTAEKQTGHSIRMGGNTRVYSCAIYETSVHLVQVSLRKWAQLKWLLVHKLLNFVQMHEPHFCCKFVSSFLRRNLLIFGQTVNIIYGFDFISIKK